MALLEKNGLDSRVFLRHLITSPKLAVKTLFATCLSRSQVASSIAILGGECVSFASCAQLLTRGSISTGCALAGSFLVFLVYATIAMLFDSRKWRAALVWEAIVQLPGALVAATCALVLVGLRISQSVTIVIHPFISAAVGIGCFAWIVVSKSWSREIRHVYTGSLLDVLLPVVKLLIDTGTLLGAAAILIVVHFGS